MKFEVSKEDIVKAVGIVEKIAGRHMTLPVLQCVYIEAVGRILTLRATNLELGIEVSLPARIEGEGKVAVPAPTLHSVLLSAYGTQKIVFEGDGGNLTIVTPTSSTVLKTLPPEDFPMLPRLEASLKFSMRASDFIKGVKAVWYCASISTVKPELSSVYINHEAEKLIFVATDSFRLAEKAVPLKHIANFEPILIPFRNIPEIVRILEGVEGEIEIGVTQNQIAFTANNLYLSSRLVNGSFPDYKQIIPKDADTKATLLKQDFAQVLKKVQIFSDKSNQVHFAVVPQKKRFVVSARNDEVGETEDAIEATLSGNDVEINFNHRYITDCFQSIASDSIEISLSGLQKPMVLRGVSDASFLYIAMPMNK